MLSLKESAMRVKDCASLYIVIVAVYSMSEYAVYCIESEMFLPSEKQRSFGSFVKKELKDCHKVPGKPKIKYSKSISKRCYIVSPWNHREVERITRYYSSSYL